MNISGLDSCANCGACLNICPKDAISIKKEGLFYTPSVNVELCVECGRCVSVCPIQAELSSSVVMSAYAGWHKVSDVVDASSSGGAFHALAKDILEDGGIVFGAVYSQDCKEVIFASTDDVLLSQLQKSKYVESLVCDAFRRIRVELEHGRRVMFCGTPCQAAGLKAFLGRDYAKLLICDFACGGLPSHKIYQHYLTDLERKYNSKVELVDFRPKTHGWKRHAMLIRFKNHKKYLRLGTEDMFLRVFVHGRLSVRDYCMNCKFSECHVSDLTIADCWLHNKLTNRYNSNGMSLILCNTDKGSSAINSMEQHFVLQELDVNAASYNNKHIQASNMDLEKRDTFLKAFEKAGLRSAYEDTYHDSVIYRLRCWASRLIHNCKRGKE